MKFTNPTFASITADFTKKVKQLEELAISAHKEADSADIAIKEANERKAAALAKAKHAATLQAKIINLLG